MCSASTHGTSISPRPVSPSPAIIRSPAPRRTFSAPPPPARARGCGRGRTRRVAPAATAIAEWLRGFGEQHGIAEFTTPELPFASLPCAPNDPAVAVWALVDAAKAASGRWTSYTGDAGGGTRAAFLIGHPDFALPPPSGPR